MNAISLGPDGWFTLALLVVVVAALVRDLAPDLVLVAGLAALMLVGVLDPAEAFHGATNEGLLTVAFLFVIAAGLRETGGLEPILSRMLSGIRSERRALFRIMAPVAGLSAFLNNTPVVAMLIPSVVEWAKRVGMSPSKLLIPLSYAAILGGACTLIGTSTNLVVSGLLVDDGYPALRMFELAWVGVPCAVAGFLYLLVVGPWLLPDRKDLIERLGEHPREYLVELAVQPECPLIGKHIEAAGLRNLPGLFLVEIVREGEEIGPVSPAEVLRAGDRLVFAGVVSTIVDLQKIRGLVPVIEPHGEAGGASTLRSRLCEVVLSPSSPLIGRSIKDADFRSLHDAAVVAVHRNGERVSTKLGDVELAAGDTLLLKTGSHFARAHRNSSDFYLVSEVAKSEPLRFHRAPIAVAILALVVIGMAVNRPPFSIPIVALLGAGAVVAFRCISASAARASIEWPVLVVIVAALGIAHAVEKTGVGDYVASLIIGAVSVIPASQELQPVLVLAAIYVLAGLFTSLVSNNAAAALTLSIALATAASLGVDHRPFAIAVAMGASASFATPIAYQTNLMVYGPGGYRFSDFVRIGLPLNLLVGVVSLVAILWHWELGPVGSVGEGSVVGPRVGAALE